jgi:hypothetical protein
MSVKRHEPCAGQSEHGRHSRGHFNKVRLPSNHLNSQVSRLFVLAAFYRHKNRRPS